MAPRNPSFEGLPFTILFANGYVHYTHTGATHFSFNNSNNTRVSTPVSRIQREYIYYQRHMATTETMRKASERIKGYSCIAFSAARDGDMLSV